MEGPIDASSHTKPTLKLLVVPQIGASQAILKFLNLFDQLVLLVIGSNFSGFSFLFA